ncbi:hypothetical protein SAY87_005540 [Trapa incisa]|uniref:NAC domain-containing protein n=1 Tax=Trapa incisa TaxID=236973 RepID=A0AAN7K6M3_9MYRT|nr:hypothetical protein SAY87_005540 [Trapa incisa]
MTESGIPPGFRFHPTEEELVGYYLKRKICSLKIDLDLITDIDLYNMEPWDIQDRCKLLGSDEQKEWYFFSHKDKKYPTGTRTNRATAHGFWKATGRDKAVLAGNRSVIIGMRKTLVFYRGRAPNGRKTDWIIHEYRLQSSENAPQEEGWVVCRAFRKPVPNERPRAFEPCAYNRIQRLGSTSGDVIPSIPNQDFYFQPSLVSSTMQDEITMEAQRLPQLLDVPTPSAILDSQPMEQNLTLHQCQRCNIPCFEDYDFDGEWKALSSLLTVPEQSGSYISSDHGAIHPVSSLQELDPSAHLNQDYYPILHFLS